MPVTTIGTISISHPGQREGLSPEQQIIIGMASSDFAEIIIYLAPPSSEHRIIVELIDFEKPGSQWLQVSIESLQHLHRATLAREKVGVIQWQYAYTLLLWAEQNILEHELGAPTQVPATKMSA